jgi:hypothetical protein
MKFTLQNIRTGMQALSDIPSPLPPKRLPRGQTVLPSYLTTAKPSPGSALLLRDRQLANTDLTTLRSGTSSRVVIRDFVRASPDLSAAVTAYVRTGITSKYTAVAKNLDGTFNPDATSTLTQILNRLNVLSDYTQGYDDSLSIRGLSETWARELMMYGGMAGELVLDKTYMPDKIQPISVTQIKLYPSTDAKRLIPWQELSGVKISLDMPSFFMVSLDQDTLEPYPISPIEPAIQGVIFSADFMNDIRRIVKKAIHPRVMISIDEEKFRKGIPPSVRADEEKMAAYMEGIISDVSNQINGLEPEDALVVFDTIGVSVIDHGNTNLAQEYTVIKGMIDAQLATGAKVLPTVLGQANSTANAASAETLLFMKYVEGSITHKLNEMFSKVLTLAVRLMGQDVYVEFAFDPIDLRPESELEAFRLMKQSRVLDLLSLGMLTDEAASIQLTGHLPPAGYKPLSGTGFRASASTVPAGDGFNGATNSGSALNQNMAPGTPKNAKSQNGGKPGAK